MHHNVPPLPRVGDGATTCEQDESKIKSLAVLSWTVKILET